MRGPGRTPETTTASMSTMSSGVGAAAGDESRVTGIGATLACGSSTDCACVGSTTRHATRTTVRQLERMVAHETRKRELKERPRAERKSVVEGKGWSGRGGAGGWRNM